MFHGVNVSVISDSIFASIKASEGPVRVSAHCSVSTVIRQTDKSF